MGSNPTWGSSLFLCKEEPFQLVSLCCLALFIVSRLFNHVSIMCRNGILCKLYMPLSLLMDCLLAMVVLLSHVIEMRQQDLMEASK